MCVSVSESTHSAVQPLDVKSDTLGLLLGGVDKELGFLSILSLRCAWHRRSQNVIYLLGQSRDFNRQALPIWRQI